MNIYPKDTNRDTKIKFKNQPFFLLDKYLAERLIDREQKLQISFAIEEKYIQYIFLPHHK
jgi:hypothetical protein